MNSFFPLKRHDTALPRKRSTAAKKQGCSRWLSLILLGIWLSACGAADSGVEVSSETFAADQHYTTGRASRDGIGKFYFGREISHVMGHRGAAWLERPGREREERTDLLISNLPLQADSVVADIGAGTGYFSFPVAEKVPEGKLLAVDIQPEMLDMIRARQADGAPANVQTVLGTADDTGLAASTVDLAFIIDAYHEFEYPREMGLSIVRALKPGGLLVLIEYRMEDPSVPIKLLHKMSQEQARTEMAAIGLEWLRTEDFLPQQHFMVFQKP